MKKANLYLAILIPLLMIIVTTFGILWCQKDLLPENNFLYLASESYEAFYCLEQTRFELIPGLPKPKAAQPDCRRTQIYMYDFKTKTSSLINQASAAHLKLSPNPVAADNYRIDPFYNSDADIIWPFLTGNTYPDLSLSKGPYRKRLNIQQKKYSSLQFIAWIENPASHP
jgi:hypothetical protein